MYIVSSPEAGCYWLQECIITMTMVMLDHMFVQSFMITHCNLKTLSTSLNCLRLFVVVYKLVNVIYRCV